jgi:hypothetical protein
MGRHAILGFVTPPLAVAVVTWSLVALSGMQQPELIGLFAHVTGANVPVTIEQTNLAEVRTIDRPWFRATTATLEDLGFQTRGDWVARRASYRGWFRIFQGDEPSVAVFAQQTTYPGAPPPSIAFVSACSPPGTKDPIGGATVWVETADEWTPDGDNGYPPFLRTRLLTGLSTFDLLQEHQRHVAEVCSSSPLKELKEQDVVTSIQADREWWFDWCAQSLIGMAADCRSPETDSL